MLVTGNARSSPRYAVKSVVSFKRSDDTLNRIYSGLTLDLNQRGCCLFSSAAMEPDEMVRLWLLHQDATELTCLDARVVWVCVDDMYGDSAYWVKAGLQFCNVSAEQNAALQTLLPSAILRLRHKKSFKHLMAILP